MTDFHSHVLPQMDDGSKSIDESIEMLHRAAQQGVRTMVATSHFYAAKESVFEFLSRRNDAAHELYTAMQKKPGLPELRLGAEVAYFPGISKIPEIEYLCVEGTRVLLLEMPFEKWTKRIFQEVDALTAVRGLTVVIAHIERYVGWGNDWKAVRELMQYDVLLQSNAEFFIGNWSRFRALRMLKAGEIQLLGSDCHNLASRAPNLGKAFDVIERKCGKQKLIKLENFASRLLSGQTVI